jgi:hypothetical protein
MSAPELTSSGPPSFVRHRVSNFRRSDDCSPPRAADTVSEKSVKLRPGLRQCTPLRAKRFWLARNAGLPDAGVTLRASYFGG